MPNASAPALQRGNGFSEACEMSPGWSADEQHYTVNCSSFVTELLLFTSEYGTYFEKCTPHGAVVEMYLSRITQLRDHERSSRMVKVFSTNPTVDDVVESALMFKSEVATGGKVRAFASATCSIRVEAKRQSGETNKRLARL